MRSTVRVNHRVWISLVWLTAIVVAGAFAAAACKGSRGTGQQAATAAPSAAVLGTDETVKGPGEASMGDRTTCAMHKGPAFTVVASTPKVEYGGRTYYFCCPHCATKFSEHPNDYIK